MRPLDFHTAERMLLKHVRRARRAKERAKTPLARAGFTLALFALSDALRELRNRWGKP